MGNLGDSISLVLQTVSENILPPGQARHGVGSIRSAEVDPVGDARSESDDTTFDTDQETTVSRARTFGLVGRDRRSVHAVALDMQLAFISHS